MLKKTALFLVLAIAAGTAFLFSGFYDISATNHHWFLVHRCISILVDNSVKHRARDIAAPPLEDTAMVRLGFEHYQGMCVQCHGAPGRKPEEFSEGLYPHAPKLKKAAEEWSASEMFWMTKYGIKMSGMPAFGSSHTDQEIWSIIAFLKKLPDIDSSAYLKLRDTSPREIEE